MSSEMKFIYILRQIYDEQVRVSIIMKSRSTYIDGYITDMGEDYVKFNDSLKKRKADRFIRISEIESVITYQNK